LQALKRALAALHLAKGSNDMDNIHEFDPNKLETIAALRTITGLDWRKGYISGEEGKQIYLEGEFTSEIRAQLDSLEHQDAITVHYSTFSHAGKGLAILEKYDYSLLQSLAYHQKNYENRIIAANILSRLTGIEWQVDSMSLSLTTSPLLMDDAELLKISVERLKDRGAVNQITFLENDQNNSGLYATIDQFDLNLLQAIFSERMSAISKRLGNQALDDPKNRSR
jgi:hypothetical protein